jgi:hypothetical protein
MVTAMSLRAYHPGSVIASGAKQSLSLGDCFVVSLLAMTLLIPMRFVTDDTNSISNCKIPVSVGADPRVCPFPGRTRRCAPTEGMLLL